MRKVALLAFALLVSLVFGLVLLVSLLSATNDGKRLPAGVNSAAKPEDQAELPKADSETMTMTEKVELDNLMSNWAKELSKQNPDQAKIEATKRRVNELLGRPKQQEKKDQ